MKSFKFRLQQALQFEVLREQKSKQQLASAHKRVRLLERYLAELHQGILSHLELARHHSQELGGQAGREAIGPKVGERKRIEQVLVDERAVLFQKQAEWSACLRKLRALESLEQKAKAEFRSKVSQQEQKQLDEIAPLIRRR